MATGEETEKKSKKPANTAFKQQRLPAWQPVMTARTVIPTFLIIGVVFIPVGAVLYTTALSVQEHVIDYTSGPEGECKVCYDTLNTTGAHETTYKPCKCDIQFTLDKFEGSVYLYYGLENFYQNHRRYVKSRDDVQLLGEVMSLDDSNKLSTDCDPYREFNSTLIAPCGAIANSIFNDTLTLKFGNDSVNVTYKGIAWPTDKASKFKNPTDTSNGLCNSEAFKNTAKPPNWSKHLCELDTIDAENNGLQNEDLIVWMRNAALPTFRKLYRKVVHTEGSVFETGLPAGDYTLSVTYNYPVKSFDGRKKMIISTVSWLGGKNPFLGIAYMVIGVLCIVLAAIFLIIHLRVGKSDQEAMDVTNRTPYIQ